VSCFNDGPPFNKKQPPAEKPTTVLFFFFRLWVRLFPAPQAVMLVHQMFVAQFLSVGEFGIPSTFLHDSLGPENSVLVMVMPVDSGGIFNQVRIVDIPPPPITVPDSWNAPGGVVYRPSD
jgi:hypothetical protein